VQCSTFSLLCGSSSSSNAISLGNLKHIGEDTEAVKSFFTRLLIHCGTSYHRFILITRKLVHVGTDERQVKKGPDDGYPPQKVDGHWKEPAEENDETIGFDAHADDGPAKEDDEDSAEKCRRTFEFMPLEEEAKGTLQPYHKSESAQKQYVSDG